MGSRERAEAGLSRARAVEIAAAAGLTNVRVDGMAKTSAEMVVDALAGLGLLKLSGPIVSPPTPAGRVEPLPEHAGRRWHWLSIQTKDGPRRFPCEWVDGAWWIPGRPAPLTPEAMASAVVWSYVAPMEDPA